MDNCLAIEMKKTQVIMNKLVYLGITILEPSKIVMYEFWYNSMKPKYRENTKLCYNDTDNCKVYMKMLKQDLIVQIMN